MALDVLERAEQEGTPLIDHTTATFVWLGEQAPKLIGDFNGWESEGGIELEPASDGVWTASVDLPLDAYIEYAFLDGEERLADPFNRRRVSNGMGKYNHFFYMPDGGPTPWVRSKKGGLLGQVSVETLAAGELVAGGKRRVHFYQPPVEEPCPLLVVWDGQDYLRRAALVRIIDNLIAEGQIRPLALAMPEHDRQARLLEYGCSDITLGFLLMAILPAAQQHLNLLDPVEHPASYGVMGASMGGLMALYTGLRLPEIFGKVLSQSGAFSLGEYDMVVWDLVRAGSPNESKIWLDVGRMEGLLDCNRRMAALLGERGYAGEYQEYNAGHNYTAWRDHLPQGLTRLFGQ